MSTTTNFLFLHYRVYCLSMSRLNQDWLQLALPGSIHTIAVKSHHHQSSGDTSLSEISKRSISTWLTNSEGPKKQSSFSAPATVYSPPLGSSLCTRHDTESHYRHRKQANAFSKLRWQERTGCMSFRVCSQMSTVDCKITARVIRQECFVQSQCVCVNATSQEGKCYYGYHKWCRRTALTMYIWVNVNAIAFIVLLEICFSFRGNADMYPLV